MKNGKPDFTGMSLQEQLQWQQRENQKKAQEKKEQEDKKVKTLIQDYEHYLETGEVTEA